MAAIALLSTVGKTIEAALAQRLAISAEENHLLPEGQMGNWKARSAEMAARLLVDAIRKSWSIGGTASLLQPDLQGAFDTVHHDWLVYILHSLRLPEWLCKWVTSYVTERTTTLTFDGKDAIERPVTAGAPQGSPVSPIIFILFITPLFH